MYRCCECQLLRKGTGPRCDECLQYMGLIPTTTMETAHAPNGRCPICCGPMQYMINCDKILCPKCTPWPSLYYSLHP